MDCREVLSTLNCYKLYCFQGVENTLRPHPPTFDIPINSSLQKLVSNLLPLYPRYYIALAFSLILIAPVELIPVVRKTPLPDHIK